MSTSGLLFIGADLTPDGAADVLAAALPDLYRTTDPDDGAPVLGRAVPGENLRLGGRITPNHLANVPVDDELEVPEHWQSAYDDLPLLWTLRAAGPGEMRGRLLEPECRRLLDDVAAATDLSLLLVVGDLLLAVRRSGSPVVTFPPGTTPDADHRDRWLPHRLDPHRHGPYPAPPT